MCLICIEIQKDKLTSFEARKNLKETHGTMEKDHILKVLKLIWKKESEEQDEMWDDYNQHRHCETD